MKKADRDWSRGRSTSYVSDIVAGAKARRFIREWKKDAAECKKNGYEPGYYLGMYKVHKLSADEAKYSYHADKNYPTMEDAKADVEWHRRAAIPHLKKVREFGIGYDEAVGD